MFRQDGKSPEPRGRGRDLTSPDHFDRLTDDVTRDPTAPTATPPSASSTRR
ncbi:hypothetical protein EKD16_09405 [Streptomonospora litoralis]|uniref:Uncharacterized protein n=1 Tax=Streptomonospora litoralis TaxID=2498135 RepID=A0A4P6PZP4_9ACTN|nr:hypothetical protein EKD16_09405 [Streptomonospora litoralis]